MNQNQNSLEYLISYRKMALSTGAEHLILLAGLLSVLWTWYLRSAMHPATLLLSTATIIAVILLALRIERKWPKWTSFDQQLRKDNRLPISIGFWCTTVPWMTAIFAMLWSDDGSNGLFTKDRFPMVVLFAIGSPLTIRFSIFSYFGRFWKSKTTGLVGDAISTAITFAVVVFVLDTSLVTAAALSIVLTLSSAIVIPKSMTSASRSFTLGEFHIIYTGVTFALISSIKFIVVDCNDEATIHGQFDRIRLLLAWSIVACSVFASICFACGIVRRSAVAFWLVLFATVLLAYLLCLFTNEADMLSWTMEFLIYADSPRSAYRRLIVLTFWSICVACTIAFAAVCSSMPRLSTVHRKYFHSTIGMVVISGLLYDRWLTLLASVLALEVFVVVEIIRLCNTEPIGQSIRDVFSTFLDHQDQGPLVLTPIYLLIGCFVPIWIDFPICGPNVVISLRHFAGLIAVGVGDAMAAVGGTYLGRTPWKLFSNGGRKTVEGTCCGFLAQVAIVFFIEYWLGNGIPTSFGRFAWILWSCGLVSGLETFSAQVDNLILPLFAYILFIWW